MNTIYDKGLHDMIMNHFGLYLAAKTIVKLLMFICFMYGLQAIGVNPHWSIPIVIVLSIAQALWEIHFVTGKGLGEDNDNEDKEGNHV